RDHDVEDRLTGELPLDLVDVRLRARLALPRREHHDVIAELDDERVVAALAGRVAEETRAELLLRDVELRRRPAAALGGRTIRRRRRERIEIRRVRNRSDDVDLEERPASARLHDARR